MNDQKDKIHLKENLFIKKSSPDKHLLNIYRKIEPVDYDISTLKCNGKLIPVFLPKSSVVSDSVRSSHSWEGSQVDYLLAISKKYDFHFIDFGCNLGVYSLNMACRGHDVIAVEPNINVVRVFSHSIRKNNFSEKIVLLHNAVTDSNEEFELKIIQNQDAIGKISKLSPNSQNKVRGIYMDHVMPLIKHKNVIIKIDVEGSEISAFKKANELFKEFNVLMVMIEWAIIKHLVEIDFVIKFMTDRNYLPYAIGGSALPIDQFMNWPIEVIWVRGGLK